MRVLLVNYEYPPAGGGAANATLFMARALAALGHEPTVLTAALPDLPRDSRENGVRVVRVASMRRAADRSNPLEMVAFLTAAGWRALRLAGPGRIEGVIAFFAIPCGPVAWLLKRLRGIPYVVSQRGGDVPGHVPGIDRLHRLVAPLRRRVLREANAVVANAPGLARLSEKTDPIPVRVVANGVDADFFRPAAAGEREAGGPFRLLYVGRLHEEKNVDVLLRAAGALGRDGRDFRLDLVGDGAERPALESLAKAEGIDGRVHWLGWRSKDEVASLYRGADCFVNPSRYEGMPNTVLEAMACGVAVVASDVGGNNDLVRDGETGLLCPAGDAPALAGSLARMMDEPAMRARMGGRSRELAASRYSWLGVAKRYVDMLGQIAPENTR